MEVQNIENQFKRKISESEKILLLNCSKNNTNTGFKYISQRLETILSIISSESMPEDERQLILTKLIKLAPKRTGDFLEVFNRHQNNLGKSKSIFHDAVKENSKLVEIKASRVLKNITYENTENLYEKLINEGTEFVPFEEALIAKYDCNIQQVKTSEFDTLNYCLFFSNIILEFSIEVNEIKNEKIEASFLLLKNKVSKSNSQNSKEVLNELNLIDLDKLGKMDACIKKIKTIFNNTELIDILNNSSILTDIYNSAKLGYSDKQHKGNVGEGQFHINKGNIIYHLENHFVKAYSYNDFVAVLKEVNNNDRKQKKGKKI